MKEKSEKIRDSLVRRRTHKKKWPEPKAELILNLHFSAKSFMPKIWHAEATLEIPVGKGEMQYFSVSSTSHTRRRALRNVIEQIENSMWFHYFRSKGVVFRVTGELEEVYRGYL